MRQERIVSTQQESRAKQRRVVKQREKAATYSLHLLEGVDLQAVP
jgi:hypothetical protein